MTSLKPADILDSVRVGDFGVNMDFTAYDVVPCDPIAGTDETLAIADLSAFDGETAVAVIKIGTGSEFVATGTASVITPGTASPNLRFTPAAGDWALPGSDPSAATIKFKLTKTGAELTIPTFGDGFQFLVYPDTA